MLPVRRNEQTWLPDFFNDFFDSSWMEKAKATAPAINVFETEHEYEVELAAPGLTKDDFKISLDAEGNLAISMEKHSEQKEGDHKKPGRYVRREFAYSKYRQLLALPEDADKDKISANMENGVLTVNIPKFVKPAPEQSQRVIEIR